MNKCAENIGAWDPSLLVKRGKLLEAAQSAVYNSGYVLKKGIHSQKVLKWHNGNSN